MNYKIFILLALLYAVFSVVMREKVFKENRKSNPLLYIHLFLFMSTLGMVISLAVALTSLAPGMGSPYAAYAIVFLGSIIGMVTGFAVMPFKPDKPLLYYGFPCILFFFALFSSSEEAKIVPEVLTVFFKILLGFLGAR